MSLLKNVLIRLSGNRYAQQMLERRVPTLQYLMGIGAGAGVRSSGEKAIFGLLQSRCEAPYCIFDVGANKGQYLKLILDEMSGLDINVHCFEPGHETYRVLKQSIKTDRRVKLNNAGIGREDGRAVLHYDVPGSTMASLTKRDLGDRPVAFDGAEEVEIRTIDTYCQEHEIEHIDLLKIDIEGNELDAFAGAKRMLEAKAISIVAFEFGGCNIDTRTFVRDFWGIFHGVGFSLYRITPSGYLHPISAYRETLEQFRTMNFVALGGGRYEERSR